MLAGLGNVGGWQFQVFANLDWAVAPDWLVHAGGMVEKHYNTGYLFSPRLALNYRLTPSQSIRFSFGRGYRAPTIFEADARDILSWSGGVAEVGTYAYRDLEPEKLDYVEVGYIGHLQPQGLRLDARAYLNKYSNFIDNQSCILDAETQASPTYYGPPCGFAAPAGYERPLGYPGAAWNNPLLPFGTIPRLGHYKAFYFFNSGNIRVHGVDFSLDWTSPDWGRFRLGHAITNITASGVGADVAVNPAAVTKDVDMEQSAPQHSTSLLWSRRFSNGWRVSLGGYWVGAMKWPNDGDDQPAYRRYDARFGKRLNLLGKDDELSLTLQGFNSDHIEFDEYLVERRAFVTYRVEY
jgi:iron complex outermembrane receptor protein